ncbi:MAG: hypothetical protein L0F87_05255 [Lactococcus sp.]|jgi:hypothetical protein|uniref:Uncharacterized protein n=1 Tax=Pseudolactococcus piscium MKFS47 TaxID=297352 RepID=A0A0D6DYG6_9LACT|nr:hypothetical protein [Lactococcus sp.]MBR3138608.1 hypothetical protein [Candidatus Saccharibacteria bacterium]CEN29029.1 Uncharacterized protein LACPI_1829 [Lactococcus piscium MKFS47]MDN5409753.1 hypothetical protein [Lactococcus sp.]MDN5436999.1 hypothetical protein [Lactococcus sp.]MDN5462637.1 hypothetical protein [Lactococcus sp.]
MGKETNRYKYNLDEYIHDTVFEDNASDKASDKKLVGLTKLSGQFTQPVFGYGR